MAKKGSSAAQAALAGGLVRGVVKQGVLSEVVPNPWNPNRMTPTKMASLRHGLRTDGWISSQALLVWGKDDAGRLRNMIIDGEHRWRAAREEGFVNGPMVVLDGLTEAQAKALTIKMNQRRGEFDDGLLSVVLHDLQVDLDTDDLGLELGFEDADLLKRLAETPIDVDVGPATDQASEPAESRPTDTSTETTGNHVRLVQLFFDATQHAEWMAGMQAIAKRHGTSNVTDTALAALRDSLKE